MCKQFLRILFTLHLVTRTFARRAPENFSGFFPGVQVQVDADLARHLFSGLFWLRKPTPIREMGSEATVRDNL